MWSDISGRLAVLVLGVGLAACVPDAPGRDAGPGPDGGPIDSGARADTNGDGGPQDECIARCEETQLRCGSSEGIECSRLCATYYSELAIGCEAEREAYFSCGFASCDTCRAESDALVACVVTRSTEPCFAYCRAAIAADCAPGAHDPEDCNCIAQYYETRGTLRCEAELDAYYACAADHPCDRIAACVAEGTALNTCGLGCASGQVGCYVGRDGRCIDEAGLQTDPDHCGGCNRDCGDGACTGGACTCAAGNHTCADGSCYANDDPLHCGSRCDSCDAPANASPTCGAGACAFQCDPGYRSEGDVCVRDCPLGQHACGDMCVPDDDASRCGATCVACPVPENGTAVCTAGSCEVACDPGYELRAGRCECAAGFHRCGTGCYADTDPAACGSSCRTCPPPPLNAHATCAGGTCGYACDTGYVAVGSSCQPCNPLTSEGCSPPQACYIARLGGVPECATPGAGLEGYMCMATNDCAPGLACLGTGPWGRCYTLCDTTVAGGCAPGQTCGRLTGSIVPNLGGCTS